MTLDEFTKISEWHGSVSGQNSIRVVAPFTYANDGQHICFYVASHDGKYFITDAGETARHVSMRGGEITYRKMLGVLYKSDSEHVKISLSGEIQSVGELSDIKFALWDAALLAYRISADSHSWMPKLNQIQFKQLVENSIKSSVGEKRIIHNAKTVGLSGHMLEFPFAVRAPANEKMIFVEPISANENGTLDWGVVHKTLGKMTDQKEAKTGDGRLVIISPEVEEREFGNAATILSKVASIQQFQKNTNWAGAFLQ